MTIVLNQAESAATGGFSLAINGNAVAITFMSLFGAPIRLQPLTVSATTPAALTFDFPDSDAEGLGALAGPVDIGITTNDRLVAHIRSTDFVALPASKDVTATVLGDRDGATLLAALGADGDLWIPAGFHGDPMVMPGCPGDFMQPIRVQIGGAVVVGPMPSTINPLDRIRGVSGYLGDMDINGFNFYGMLFPKTISLVHTDGTLGVSICRMNDALDVVLRVRGDQSWATPASSPFRFVASGSHAIPLHLIAAPLTPALPGQQVTQGDSFGNPCVPGRH